MQLIDWSNFNGSLLIEVTRPEGKFISSGVAINSTTILTAAHCLEGEILSIKIAGEFDVESFELHPDYNKKESNYLADVAKIKLKSPLPNGTVYYPIIKDHSQLNGKIIRIGFGAREQRNARTIITPVMKQIRNFENVLELHDMYSYSGDSGGPVFVQNGAQMYLVAIHSTLSYGPEGKYSFNPLLSSHREWLAS